MQIIMLKYLATTSVTGPEKPGISAQMIRV